MKKNKIAIIILIIILLVILLIPTKRQLKDGGTIEYKSLIYKITKHHRLNGNMIDEYTKGTTIEIFGFEVFNNVESFVNVYPSQIKVISTKIKDNTLTNTGATIVIIQENDDKYTYGEEYRIDKKTNNDWIELEVVVEGNYGFTSMGYYVDEENTIEMDIDWEWLYGELDKGTYRIVKDVYYEGVTEQNEIEFDID